MGHLPFEKWVFYWGFRVGHGSRVRRGQNRASRRSWKRSLLVLEDGFAKSCLRGTCFMGVFGDGESGCYRFQRSDLISCIRVGTRKWVAKELNADIAVWCLR